MNSPFVNFKLKPGISRSLTGAALFLSAAALINAGESKAADFTCFLSTLSSCSGQLGDKAFSGFMITGVPIASGDFVNVSESGGLWTVQVSFAPPKSNVTLGNFKYNVGITDPVATFDTATVDINVSGTPIAGNPIVKSTITGIPNSPPFNVDNSMGSVTRNFDSGTKNIVVSQDFTVTGPVTRRLSGWTTDFTQKVPAPLPLLGAGAAFGFSRRLRSRIKTSAAA